MKVVRVPLTDDDPLPFAEGEFDLVLNRHSGFNSKQVARVLAMGGTFLTQQVHGLWAYDLLAAFDAKPQWPTSTLDKYVPRLKAAGLTIVNTQEWSGTLAFTDVGAIVYYLKAVPWLVPGFSVETHLGYLLKLQRRLDSWRGSGFCREKISDRGAQGRVSLKTPRVSETLGVWRINVPAPRPTAGWWCRCWPRPGTCRPAKRQPRLSRLRAR